MTLRKGGDTHVWRIALCGELTLEEALDLSWDRLLNEWMIKYDFCLGLLEVDLQLYLFSKNIRIITTQMLVSNNYRCSKYSYVPQHKKLNVVALYRWHISSNPLPCVKVQSNSSTRQIRIWVDLHTLGENATEYNLVLQLDRSTQDNLKVQRSLKPKDWTCNHMKSWPTDLEGKCGIYLCSFCVHRKKRRAMLR
jgi:hypothetical protein